MKKIIRSKHDENTNRATPSTSSESVSQISKLEKRIPDVQPPLPLDPPPPDNLLNMNLVLKQEIEDTEYQSSNEETSEVLNQEGLDDYRSNDIDDTEKLRPMCRDFIRGNCIRAGTCKFSHKCDISQLVGVYTFCKNFQNSVCTLSNCKYVHASVFEEQHFYRTAELPPHALAHHKKNNIFPPLPPPEESPTTMQSIFNTPPPVIRFRPERPPPVTNCVSTSKIETRPFAQPLKREWEGIENYPSTSQEPVPESIPKRCRNCGYLELSSPPDLTPEKERLPTFIRNISLLKEFMKEKCEKLKKAKLEAHKNLEALNKKRERLYATLMTLFKPMYESKVAASGLLPSTSTGDRNKWLMDQISGVMNSNTVSAVQEDTSRSNLNTNPNLSSLLAKLLNVYRQHVLSTDPSRKT